jgi:hypothetical protein
MCRAIVWGKMVPWGIVLIKTRVCQILWNTSHVFVFKAVKRKCFCCNVVFGEVVT